MNSDDTQPEDGAPVWPTADTLADVPGLRIDKPHPRAPGFAIYHNATGLPVLLCRTSQAAEQALQRLRGPDWTAIKGRSDAPPTGIYALAIARALEVGGVSLP